MWDEPYLIHSVGTQFPDEPQIAWSLINGAGIDPYTGLDQFNRIVDNRWFSTADGADLDRIQHGYDRASNRLYRKNPVAASAGVNLDELYTYDGIYRLSEMQRGQLNPANTAIVAGTLNFAQAWGLDATGNWQQFWQNDTGASWDLQQSRAANSMNEITSIIGGGWAQPAYDAAGNTSQSPQSNTPSNANASTFDAWNRIVDISNGGALINRSAYDSGGRRITKLVGGSIRHYYFSAEWQSLDERLGVSSFADRQFVCGERYIDDLLLRDRGGERLYATLDPNWNVTAVIASKVVLERYMFSPYGAPAFTRGDFSPLSSSQYDWRVLFCAYPYDLESQHFRARHRQLDSLMGRWLSQDPLFAASGGNRYEYVHGRPLVARDPTGLASTQRYAACCTFARECENYCPWTLQLFFNVGTYRDVLPAQTIACVYDKTTGITPWACCKAHLPGSYSLNCTAYYVDDATRGTCGVTPGSKCDQALRAWMHALVVGNPNEIQLQCTLFCQQCPGMGGANQPAAAQCLQTFCSA